MDGWFGKRSGMDGWFGGRLGGFGRMGAFGWVLTGVCVVVGAGVSWGQTTPLVIPTVMEERVVGPYNVHVLAGGPGLRKAVPAESRVLRADGAYTLAMWVEMTAEVPGTVLLAGVGDAMAEDSRYLQLVEGRPALRYGAGNVLAARGALPRTGWHYLVASSDGVTPVLYVDGVEAARGTMVAGRVAAELVMAPVTTLPVSAATTGGAGMGGATERLAKAQLPETHFGGHLAGVTLLPEAIGAAEVKVGAAHGPEVALIEWEEASRPWPLQVRGQAGYEEPEDPALLPKSRAPLGKPTAKPLPAANAPVLEPTGTADSWRLRSHWMLAEAPKVSGDGAAFSTVGFADRLWMRATVPGTVLTTMIDRGVYPDSDFGLNNLAIPESLNKQDYWYRIEFPTPREAAGHHAALTFEGINFAAEAWLNGKRLGDVRGAFLRGQFDVSGMLRAEGGNALAVRVSPPPHPGIPEEESIKAGPGENGGAMCIDGPTFVASEGWDWIPSIRDRNTGIWQDVVLQVTDQLKIGDPQVITHLPLPDTSTADVLIDVPVRNLSDAPVAATVRAVFEGVTVTKQATVAPGETVVHLTPAEEPELRLRQPRLWWPNGYGRPELYHLVLSVSGGGAESDRRQMTFGVREVTYELSLFDGTGHLRRVEVSPTVAHARGEEVVDVRHEGMRRTAEYWAATLTPAGEHALREPGSEAAGAVRPVANEPGFTDLVLKVNGVRIAARGGNWGMDDSRKRVSREHLEPFFRLNQLANVNIIRNWVGQNTEETFYQLADEYGMMVWNDFWDSTQDYNAEAQDVPLFLDNARDVVRRFRNHPSIVMWCGRNEGVPQPVLNQGLIRVFREEDGTRYYSPSSNRVNLRDSGPYHYQDPALYYSTLNKGFSVELGIASLSTLESLQASMAAPDQWPVSDAWAYHDWHQAGNGDVHPLEEHLNEQFGAATDLKDYERKMQMYNYVGHRAIFEGFNQHLWSPNSGRMLWMTQPAWPSNMWQILSSDYDTQASFYGVKKACEPLHVQLDLSDYTVSGVNTTKEAAVGLTVRATVYSIGGKVLLSKDGGMDLAADAVHPMFVLPVASMFAEEGAVLVELQMMDGKGAVVSRNVYWLAGQDSGYRKLNTLAAVTLGTKAAQHRDGEEMVVEVDLSNRSAVPALAAKLTLMDAKTGERILPAYLSDNYVSLLPGETQHVTVRYPVRGGAAGARAKLGLRGWNVAEAMVAVP